MINMTLGRVMLDRFMLDRVTPIRGCGFACTGLVAAACAKAVAPAARMITTADKRVDKKAEKRSTMRLLRLWLLRVRAPRLLVCLRGESLGGQCLG